MPRGGNNRGPGLTLRQGDLLLVDRLGLILYLGTTGEGKGQDELLEGRPYRAGNNEDWDFVSFKRGDIHRQFRQLYVRPTTERPLVSTGTSSAGRTYPSAGRRDSWGGVFNG